MSAEAVREQSGSGYLDQGPAIADWLEALSHDSPFEQPQEGAAPAGTAPPLTAAPSLLSLMKDADRNVRVETIASAGNLVHEIRRVLPALRAALTEAALHDEDDGVRAEAVQALLRAGPQPSTEVAALVDALHSAIDVVRFHAAVALGDSGPGARPAVPTLIHASYWDEDPAVRVGAALALWKIDDHRRPLVVYVLTKALGDANDLICWIAAESLGQMGPAALEAIPALRRALQRSYKFSIVATGIKLALERIEERTPDELASAPLKDS